jgi:cytochrome c556
MIRAVLAMTALTAAATLALAQSDPIEARKALMDANNKHARDLRAMTRGEAPYDQAKVNAAFAQWHDTAQKFGGLFPENSKTGKETRATPKIWEQRADFDAKLAAFAKAVGDHKDKVKSADDLKGAFSAVDKACNDCHEPYRARRQS